MGFLFNQVFWGALLIILGITIIIKVLFHVNIPTGRIIVAFILIYIGIWFLIGGKFNRRQQGNTVIFNESQITVTQPSTDEYNIIFGKGTMDVTGVVLNRGVARIKLNTIFGAGVLKINPDIPAKIVIDSPFAAAKLPDGNNVTFGSGYTYQTRTYQEGKDYLLIEADVVFGGLEIREVLP